MPLTTINVAVNDYCNNRCQMCNIWRNTARDGFLLEEMRRFLEANESAFAGVGELSLTGGEPFMRSDLTDVALLFTEHLPKLRALFITTNGTYGKRCARFAEKLAPRVETLGICVSIEGERAKHNEIRGVDSFDLCIETLETLKALDIKNLYLYISTTLVAGFDPLVRLKEVEKLAVRFGVDFSFRVADVSSSYYRNDATVAPSFSREVRDSLISYIQEKKHGNPYYEAMIEQLSTGSNSVMRSEDGQLRCLAGEKFVFIQADGVVRPCIYSERTLGNIFSSLKIGRLEDLGKFEPCPCCTECTIYPMLG